jgi:hypothetical protein
MMARTKSRNHNKIGKHSYPGHHLGICQPPFGHILAIIWAFRAFLLRVPPHEKEHQETGGYIYIYIYIYLFFFVYSYKYKYAGYIKIYIYIHIYIYIYIINKYINIYIQPAKLSLRFGPG